jgi:hypothetical protein
VVCGVCIVLVLRASRQKQSLLSKSHSGVWHVQRDKLQFRFVARRVSIQRSYESSCEFQFSTIKQLQAQAIPRVMFMPHTLYRLQRCFLLCLFSTYPPTHTHPLRSVTYISSSRTTTTPPYLHHRTTAILSHNNPVSQCRSLVMILVTSTASLQLHASEASISWPMKPPAEPLRMSHTQQSLGCCSRLVRLTLDGCCSTMAGFDGKARSIGESAAIGVCIITRSFPVCVAQTPYISSSRSLALSLSLARSRSTTQFVLTGCLCALDCARV